MNSYSDAGGEAQSLADAIEDAVGADVGRDPVEDDVCGATTAKPLNPQVGAQPVTPIDFYTAIFGGADRDVYMCSLPNLKNDPEQPPERRVITRTPSHIAGFIEKWDRAKRGLFFCVGTVPANAETRSKETVVETVCLHADIDFKDLDSLGEDPREHALRQLSRLKYRPSAIVFSGGGLHCYWLFKEAMATQGNIERIELALGQLADLVAGDTQVCHVASLLRVPSSHNSKNGQWIEVAVLEVNNLRYELDDLEEWLSEQSPVLLRKERERGATVGERDPILEYAKQYGWKPPIDVEARLQNMMYMGGGDSGIHATQVAVTAALLSRGMPLDVVVERVLAATRIAAGDYGKRWNWRLEERNIRKDGEKWVKDHPEINERQQRERAKERDEEKGNAGVAEQPAPGMGHNSKGKLPLHVVLANAYIVGMRGGIFQQVRRVPDQEGAEHLWRCCNGLWFVQADKDVARSMHPVLQKIVNDLGRENKSASKLFNEATAHVLRSAAVCNHGPVTFDAHGTVATLSGLIDPVTLAVEPLKPEHYATWCLPVRYDPNADCKFWKQLLNDAFADMTEADRKITIQLIQELVGMALIDNKPKSLSRAMVLYGVPDAGKTVILKVIAALFGGAITTPFAALDKNHGLQAFKDRLPWVLGEAFNQSGWYVSDLVKSLITGDPVEINGKNMPAISMKVNAPAFWGTNHPPKFKESSGAMATRMEIIPMTRSFDKAHPTGVAAEARKRNPAWEPHDLIINTERSGVLNWALAGLKRALERGHFVNTEAGKALVEQSRKDSNSVAAFVDECIDADEGAMMSVDDFYAAFKQWWLDEHGDKTKVPSRTTVGNDLASLTNARIAQNKAKFKNKASQRFYLGAVLNKAGERAWQDAASSAGGATHKLATSVSDVTKLILPKWMQSEEYRRVVPNIQRFKERQILDHEFDDDRVQVNGDVSF
jgi:P4 family phage/plasmid primase-like protien